MDPSIRTPPNQIIGRGNSRQPMSSGGRLSRADSTASSLRVRPSRVAPLTQKSVTAGSRPSSRLHPAPAAKTTTSKRPAPSVISSSDGVSKSASKATARNLDDAWLMDELASAKVDAGEGAQRLASANVKAAPAEPLLHSLWSSSQDSSSWASGPLGTKEKYAVVQWETADFYTYEAE